MRTGTKARRLSSRPWSRITRRALMAAGLWLAGATGGLAEDPAAEVILGAEYGAPTTRYAHAVLGDAVEWGTLVLRLGPCAGCATGNPRQVILQLPQDRVFEDLAPRIITDTDGRSLVMVVESSQSVGARLALYDGNGLFAATPHIGQRNRWLAPIGAADLDGDGHLEIAYIDRPHLAKTLRIWRLRDGALHEVASRTGLSNHRIGQDFITSGLRHCGDQPELIIPSADWSRIMAARLVSGEIVLRDLGPFDARLGLDAILTCTAN